MKLINRNGRTESQIEGKDYLTTEGQFSSDPSKHYFTAGGKLGGTVEPPTPPLEYTIELPDTVDGTDLYNVDLTLGDEVVYAPVLEQGQNMFRESSITSFEGDLPTLTNGDSMFYNCSNLTSFTGDLPALTDGIYMFQGCTDLTSFNGDLPSLTEGRYMFRNCKLDLESVQRIANSLPTHTSGTHRITIGVDGTQVSQEQQDETNATLLSKGWTVEWQRN